MRLVREYNIPNFYIKDVKKEQIKDSWILIGDGDTLNGVKLLFMVDGVYAITNEFGNIAMISDCILNKSESPYWFYDKDEPNIIKQVISSNGVSNE